MDLLHDLRTDCYSILVRMSSGDYVNLVRESHSNRGGIRGQRDVLKTTTAKRIRERMVDDLQAGAVIPPLVVGLVSENIITECLDKPGADFMAILPERMLSELTIIDGMQRTAALIQACEADPSVLDRELRVEFWVAKTVKSLIYRMLVLNTGQVPWTLARQLTVVYEPLLDEIKQRVTNIDRFFSPDKQGRRVASAQYSEDALVELYLAFSLRKTGVDAKETLSEEFSRLDFVDNLSDDSFQTHFYDTLKILVEFDKAFDRYQGSAGDRFARGRDVFGSQPARIGFTVAVAQHVLGRPGLDRTHEERIDRMGRIVRQCQKLLSKLNLLDSADMGDFLRLDVLSEILERKKVGQVGRYERSVFFEAFKVLIDEDFEVPNMEPCWRAN